MDGSTLCSLTADLRDEAEDDAGQSPGPQGGLRDRLGTKAPKPPAATSRENAPSELIFSSPARPSSFSSVFVLSSSPHPRHVIRSSCRRPAGMSTTSHPSHHTANPAPLPPVPPLRLRAFRPLCFHLGQGSHSQGASCRAHSCRDRECMRPLLRFSSLSHCSPVHFAGNR